MDTKLVIHCIGLEGLTITVAGADHSIPMRGEVLRVTTLLGAIDYTIPQLPVTYDFADLNGNLTISDSSGMAVYRWRLHPPAQLSATEHPQSRREPTRLLERERRSPSISAQQSYIRAENHPSSRALNRLENPQNAISNGEPMVEDPDGPRRLRSGKIRKLGNVKSSLSPSSTEKYASPSTSSSPGQRQKRLIQPKIKETFNKLKNNDSSALRSGTPPIKKQKLGMRNTATTTDDENLDPLDSDIALPSKSRTKRRERRRLETGHAEKSERQTLDMTSTREVFLQRLVDRLLRENDEDSEPFAKPVDGIPTYHSVIKRAMDLRTLKENLSIGFYSSVEAFEADFQLMIENSILFNGFTHDVSQSGLRLLNAFNALMTLLPGRPKDMFS